VETPLDRLFKKISELKDCTTLDKQQELMLEAYHATYVFVKQKTTSPGYNAQDESNLLKFFKAVQNERHFSKQYRQLANDFIEEIEKPSRRFRVKLEDLYILNPKKTEKQEEASLSSKTE
jgi:hypothetical protein